MVTLSDLRKFTEVELHRILFSLDCAFPNGTRRDKLELAIVAAKPSLVAVTAAAKAPPTPASVGAKVDEIVAVAVAASEQRIAQSMGAADLRFQNAIDDIAAMVATNKAAPVSGDEITAAVAAVFKPIRDALFAAPVEVQHEVIAVAPRERRPIADVFGIAGATGDCEVWGEAYAFDPRYKFNLPMLKNCLNVMDHGGNFWLWGQRGTGKTMFAMNLAARLGRPFFRVSFDSTMERAEFIGADGLKFGNTEFQEGQVLKAYHTAGAICLLDELSMVRSEYASVLNTLLERDSHYTVPSTGVVYHRAAGMCFVAADNTNGSGDSTGRFGGTRPLNSALLDRFDRFTEVKYLPPLEEIDLLVQHGADPATATALINLFSVCRAEVGGSLVEPPSLRSAFAFCEGIDTPEVEWEECVVNKSPIDSQEALRQLFTEHWGR
jgi:hypothetical protein